MFKDIERSLSSLNRIEHVVRESLLMLQKIEKVHVFDITFETTIDTRIACRVAITLYDRYYHDDNNT